MQKLFEEAKQQVSRSLPQSYLGCSCCHSSSGAHFFLPGLFNVLSSDESDKQCKMASLDFLHSIFFWTRFFQPNHIRTMAFLSTNFVSLFWRRRECVETFDMIRLDVRRHAWGRHILLVNDFSLCSSLEGGSRLEPPSYWLG